VVAAGVVVKTASTWYCNESCCANTSVVVVVMVCVWFWGIQVIFFNI
jgi:hypothetical protein